MAATKPEIDWKNHESVVKAAYPPAHQWMQRTPDEWEGLRRRLAEVCAFEAMHNPAAVDVESALYNALKAVQGAIKGGITLCECSPEMALAGCAIKLYEQKGKL